MTIHVRNFGIQAVLALTLGLPALALKAGSCDVDQSLPKVRPWSEIVSRKLGGVSAMDAYVDGDALHVLATSNTGSADRLYYLATRDGGKRWVGPVALPLQGPVTTPRRGNDAQIVARKNVILAFWQVQADIPVVGTITGARSNNGGRSWTAGMKPADGAAFDQSHLDAAVDAAGRFHLVWLDDRDEQGIYQGLRYAHSNDNGLHWTHHMTLDSTTCTCCWTRLVCGNNADVYALYRDAEPHDMKLARSNDAGSNWMSAGSVGRFGWNFSGCPHAGGGLIKTQANTLSSVIWTGKPDREGLYFMQSTDNGNNWTEQKMADKRALHADLAAADDHTLLAVWDSNTDGSSSILATRSCDGGQTWSNSHSISTPGKQATHPRAVATINYGYFVYWTEQLPNTAWSTITVLR